MGDITGFMCKEYVQIQERISEAMDTVMSRDEEQKVLICMHGRAMRILLSTLMDYPLSEMDTFPHHNAGFYQLEHAEGAFKILKFNEHNHLNGLGS